MKQKAFNISVVLLLLACLVGCRNTSKLAHRHDGDTHAKSDSRPEAIVIERCDILSANFQCEVDGVTVSGQVRLRRDSVLWLSASKFIELGRAKFTADSVFVYAKVMNRYFEGTYSDLYEKTGVNTDYAALQALFLGENEIVRRNWIMAEYSDWRETVDVRDDGSMIKNKRFPYKADMTVRSKPYSGHATIVFSKVRMNQATTYPYSVGPAAKKY